MSYKSTIVHSEMKAFIHLKDTENWGNENSHLQTYLIPDQNQDRNPNKYILDSKSFLRNTI